MARVFWLLLFFSGQGLALGTLPPCEINGVQAARYLVTSPFAYYAMNTPAVAIVDPNNQPTIVFHSREMRQLPQEIQQHVFYHECAHIQLNHVYRLNRSVEEDRKAEIEADCEGTKNLVKEMKYNKRQLNKLVEQVRRLSPEATTTHGSGDDRADVILLCGRQALENIN